MSRYLWTRKTVAKCHAGELGHGARTKAGENLLITRLQPVEKRSTQWRNALSPPTPPSSFFHWIWRRNNGYTRRIDPKRKRYRRPSTRISPTHSHCTRIDSSFNFKVNLFNISLYLSRLLRIKRKFRRSDNFSSMIQDIFPIHWEKRFHWGKKRTWSSRVIYIYIHI